MRLDGSAVVLQRPRDVNTDVAPGEDSRRASLDLDWRSAYTLYNGIRLEPFVEARNDVFNVDNVTAANTGLHTTDRPLATAGIDASWPFFRRTGDLTVVLEPLAQLAVSPRATTNPTFPTKTARSSTSTKPTCSKPTSRPASTITKAARAPTLADASRSAGTPAARLNS